MDQTPQKALELFFNPNLRVHFAQIAGSSSYSWQTRGNALV
jgi:hypothetical protein